MPTEKYIFLSCTLHFFGQTVRTRLEPWTDNPKSDFTVDTCRTLIEKSDILKKKLVTQHVRGGLKSAYSELA